ncbi:nucleic acid binding protein Tc38 [Trypanosoma rangeli]|uniref:Nucleic acid binding protein Tc38 n=1 Tax=Trypanosoma rangeli TaxID=5698 RepID=A0A3R7JZB4_TRYRA|nr:nucleic acid binding protein Tc38 [Trypanosoma rangeli]RNE99271.1 nucleic acid binding protein Tc38 [Trypanosoma rangeli]|eukprot:RNE99271.1 nucleic acid binding protein Tc38 [Trypanosoma rangeli]
MNSKSRVGVSKGDKKGVSRQRPPKEERQNASSGDAARKSSVGRRPEQAHPKRAQAASGPSVQQKMQVTTVTSWVKGGSSLSFADVVRKKTDTAAMNMQLENSYEEAAEVVCGESVAVELAHDIQEDPINVPPESNENEDIAYVTMQQDAAIVQAIIPSPPEEEVEEMPTVNYYVLDIDRIVEESVNLPPRTMATATEYMGVYTFSGQAGKPPTPPATTQLQQQFYRPESAAARAFAGMGGTTDLTRGQHWGPQPGHAVDYTNANWSLPDRAPRVFHQGMQYSSYAPPPSMQQQQAQRNFIPQAVNRILQNDSADPSLRHIRDPGTFNRQPGNGGDVW